MKKSHAIVILLLIMGIVAYSNLCLSFGHSDQKGHTPLCASSAGSCLYIGTEIVLFFILPFLSAAFLLYIVCIPKRTILPLLKPPQFQG